MKPTVELLNAIEKVYGKSNIISVYPYKNYFLSYAIRHNRHIYRVWKIKDDKVRITSAWSWYNDKELKRRIDNELITLGSRRF